MLQNSVRALLSGIIDYAGLFPPASLDLKTALSNYSTYRKGDAAFMLGRFVVTAGDLEQLPHTPGEPLPLTVLVGPDVDRDLELIRPERNPGRKIDSIELKASTPAQIRSAAARMPEGVTVYFEIPAAQDPREILRAISEAGARVKMRMGGATPDAFPGSRDVARFLHACAEADVAFKATAGLHYPWRGVHPIGAEPDSPSVLMHGFLNVFLGAAFVRAGLEMVQAVRLLEDQSPQAFRFEPECVSWRDEQVETDQIADARRNLAISFGSCSFEEPVAELRALGLL